MRRAVKRLRRVLRVFLTAALLLIPAGGMAQEPFTCSGEAYSVRFSPAQLFSIDQSVSPFDFTAIGGTAQLFIPAGIDGSTGETRDVELNNLGYRRTDDLLYAMALKVFVPNNSAANGNYGIVKIDSTGTVYPVAVPAPAPIPGIGSNTYRFPAGDVSIDGSTLYINAQVTSNVSAANSTLYAVDLDTLVVTPVTKTWPAGLATVNVADWAVSPIDNMLYGAAPTPSPARIWQLNPTTGVMTIVPGSGALGLPTGTIPLDAYGGAWFNAEGNLFLYRNRGEIYEIQLDGGPAVGGCPSDCPQIVSTQVGGPSSDYNDAAACAATNPQIDVEKLVSLDGGTTYHEADTAPGPTATTGNDLYFKFVVSNVGNVTLSSIDLNDPDYDLSGCTIPGTLAPFGQPGSTFVCEIGPVAALSG